MKKAITILLMAVLLLSLAACGGNGGDSNTPSGTNDTPTTQEDNNNGNDTPTTQDETSTAGEEDLVSVDGYAYTEKDKIVVPYTVVETEPVNVEDWLTIKIIGYEIYRDVDDLLAICLNLEVENKTDNTFAVSDLHTLRTMLYQNGTQPNRSLGFGLGTIWQSRGVDVNIRPGAVSNGVFVFHALEDIESDIEVEFYIPRVVMQGGTDTTDSTESVSDTIHFSLK